MRTNKNGLPDPTAAEIAAVTDWLDQNQSKIREYMQIWMKGSLTMVEDHQTRQKINKAAHDYEKATGVDFYAPFREVIQDSSALVVKIEQSLQQYASSTEMSKFQTELGTEYKPFAITIRPKFFLYYKSHNLYPGIQKNRPLRVATSFLQDENAIPAYEYNGTSWNPMTISQTDMDNRATLLVSPMIEFPDGSTLFINPVEGCGKCIKNTSHGKPITCILPGKGCKCQKINVIDAESIF